MSAKTGADRPIRVIWNATAGRRPLTGNKVDEAGIVGALEAVGLTVEFCAADSADRAKRYAAEALATGGRLVIAAGGDGTIGAVGSALIGSEAALGILPLGSVMNIPRMLGIPRDLAQAAAVIAAGRTRAIDVGEANGRLFYETVAVGMGPAIFRESDRFENGDYGTLWRALRNAFRYRPARIVIELDDGRTIRSRALMVTIGNGPYMGLGMTVAPGADLDDGRFDVCVFRHFSKFELLRHLASIAYGRRRYSPHVLTERSSHVLIKGSRPLPIRADAESLGYTPLECRVRPRALNVVVPVGEGGGWVA